MCARASNSARYILGDVVIVADGAGTGEEEQEQTARFASTPFQFRNPAVKPYATILLRRRCKGFGTAT